MTETTPASADEGLFPEARRRLVEGDLPGARHLYLDVLDRQPTQTAHCLHDLGLIAALQGQHARAADLFRKALRLDPQLPDGHANLVAACEHSGDRAGLIDALLEQGSVLVARGKHDQAAQVHRRILALEPLHYAATVNLGNGLLRLGEGVEAAQWLARGLRLLGRLGFGLGLFLEELETHLAGRLPLDGQPPPDGVPVAVLDRGERALAALAQLLSERGLMKAALACHARIVKEMPGYALGHFNLATQLLAQGDYARGWREYEWRWECPDFPLFNRRHLPVPLWRGEPLAGKHILVWMEQGHGDAIQFLPLLARLTAQGATVTLEVVPGLLRLCTANLPGIEVLGRPEQPGEPSASQDIDCMAPLMGLPVRLGLSADALPLATNYLQPVPEDQKAWIERLADRAGFKVGLVWAGDPKHVNDWRRSLALETLRPLLDVPGVCWYSLQVGPPSEQLQGVDGLHDLAPQLGDFADTAAAVAAFDLVIAVDTGVAHLAAAQGKPVWLLLSALGEWRWGCEMQATPWYPSIRIFRQSSPGDWEEVIVRVRKSLSEWVKRR